MVVYANLELKRIRKMIKKIEEENDKANKQKLAEWNDKLVYVKVGYRFISFILVVSRTSRSSKMIR